MTQPDTERLHKLATAARHIAHTLRRLGAFELAHHARLAADVLTAHADRRHP